MTYYQSRRKEAENRYPYRVSLNGPLERLAEMADAADAHFSGDGRAHFYFGGMDRLQAFVARYGSLVEEIPPEEKRRATAHSTPPMKGGPA